MKQSAWYLKAGGALAALALTAGLVAWQNPSGVASQVTHKDTIPSKKPRDFDEVLKDLDKSKVELEKTLQSKEWQEELKASLKEIDAAKIKMDVDLALKEVDLKNLQAELEKSMKDLDVQKLKTEIQKSLESVDAEKIRAEVQASIAKIDMESVKKELEKIKEIDLKNLKVEMEKLGPQIEKSLEGARESIEKARTEINGYKDFVDELEKDGLIDKKEYSVEYKNGALTINDKKIDASVSKKYSFLRDKSNFSIHKNGDDFTINTEK